MELDRARFRVRGDVVECWPAYEEFAYRIELWGDEIEKLAIVNPLTGEEAKVLTEAYIYPAKHFVLPAERIDAAMAEIQQELDLQLEQFKQEGKLLEAQRLAAAHAVRHGTAQGSGLLLGHRKLQPRAGQSKAGRAAVYGCTIFSPTIF